MNNNKFSSVFVLSFAILIPILFTTSISAQKSRDNMTDEEDMQIRDAPELDLRLKVYVKIIDRRILAMTDPSAAKSKQVQKDLNEWGELRTGTFGNLMWDINKTLDEAVSKINDSAEHDINNPLVGKSLRLLAVACSKWQPQFKLFEEKSQSEKEKGLVLGSVENCDLVGEASAKLPNEEKKKKQ